MHGRLAILSGVSWVLRATKHRTHMYSSPQLSARHPHLHQLRETERLNYGASEFSEKSPSRCSAVLCGDMLI